MAVRSITLKEFLESPWFTGAARIAAVMLLPFAGYLWHEFSQHTERLTQIEAENATKVVQLENRDRIVDAAILNSANSISAMSKDIILIKEAVATVNGKLSILLDERTATDTRALYEGIIPVPVSDR